MKRLFQRCGIDAETFDFTTHLPLKESKTPYFRAAWVRFKINPARAYASGDERKDYIVVVETGMHPFIVVSNGKEVVLSNRRGRYKFDDDDYRSDMNIFVSKPACYELLSDENNVPYFFLYS